MIVLVLVLIAAAGLLVWLVAERNRLSYGALRSPRVLVSALSSINPIGDARSRRRGARGDGVQSSARESRSGSEPEDVEVQVRRHLYGGGSN